MRGKYRDEQFDSSRDQTGPQALKSSIQLNELSSTLFVVVLNPKLLHFRCAAICLDVLSFVEMCCNLFRCAVIC